MANLDISTLQRRPGRIETLLGKLAKSDPFETVSTGKFKADQLFVYSATGDIMVYSPKDPKDFKDALKLLQDAPTQKAKNFAIGYSKNDKDAIPLTKLKKTGEFGGKSSDSGLIKENIAVKQLSDEIAKAIAINRGPLTIALKMTKIHDIVGIRPTENTKVKSDFELINSDGKAVIWISHKDGTSVKHFQQWAGVSERDEPRLFKHRETQSFIADLLKAKPLGLLSGETYWRTIDDPKLKMMAVYGNDFGGPLGEQNVSVALQGAPFLENKGTYWAINAGNSPMHRHYNGASMDHTDYEAVLLGLYAPSRNNAGILHTRLGIWPIASRGGSGLHEFPPIKR